MKLFHTNVSTVLHKETRLVENIFQLWGKNVFEKLKSTIFSHSFIDIEKKKVVRNQTMSGICYKTKPSKEQESALCTNKQKPSSIESHQVCTEWAVLQK